MPASVTNALFKALEDLQVKEQAYLLGTRVERITNETYRVRHEAVSQGTAVQQIMEYALKHHPPSGRYSVTIREREGGHRGSAAHRGESTPQCLLTLARVVSHRQTLPGV